MVTQSIRLSLDDLVSEYAVRNPRSKALSERAKASMPGGNTRSGVWIDPFPPYIERGEGVFLYDVDGHRLLDFVFNNSPSILGHAHPVVVEALQRQAALGTGFNRPTELEIELAELLQARVPSLERLRFCNSGTEAVLNAIRAAIAFTGKRKIAKFEGAYHGISDHALVSVSPAIGPELGSPERPRPVPSSAGLSGAADEVIVLPFNDAAACASIIQEHAGELAAVIIDPLLTGGGVILPEDGFLSRLRAITEQAGVLLIFDEIITFRVSSGGAQGLYGIRPDLTTMGKVIAGGTAGGAFGGRAEIMALFDPTSGAPQIPQAGTFNANPLTMVAGLATLRTLTPAAYAKLDATTERLGHELETVLADAGVPGTVITVGSICRIHFMDRAPRNYRETALNDKGLQKRLFYWLLNHDIHWTPGGWGFVALPMEDRHVDEMASAVRAALQEI